MPDGYEFALFLHIVGALAIAGAAAISWLVMLWMRRAETVQELRPLAVVAVWADRAFPIASVLVLIAGIYMVEDVNWGWGTGWVNTSLIALIIMGAGGGLLMTPRLGAIHKAAKAAADGPVPAEIASKINDPVLWGTLHSFTVALLAIIWNMSVKPGDAQAGIMITLGFVLGAVSVLPRLARD